MISKNDDLRTLTEWFWMESARIPHVKHEDGLCQCGSEILIEQSENPDIMRAFLIFAVFMDQLIYAHFHYLRDKFHERFRFPKLHSHVHGMVSPNWFINSFNRWDTKMNWSIALPIAKTILEEVSKWLKEFPEREELSNALRRYIREEIRNEFSDNAQKVYDTVKRTGLLR